MRKIPLLRKEYVTPLEDFPESERKELLPEKKRTESFEYAAVLDAIILKAPQQLTLDSIQRCDAINAALEAAKKNGNVLILEEREYEYIKNKIEGFSWARWSRFTSDFVKDIQNAEQFTPSEGA